MNPYDFGHALTYHIAPQGGQGFDLPQEIFQLLFHGLTQNLQIQYRYSQKRNPNDFGDPLTFPVASP